MREIADILAEPGTLPSAEILPELQTLTVRGVALHGWQSGGSDGVPCKTTSGIELDGCRAANVPGPAVVVTASRSGSSYGADIWVGRLTVCMGSRDRARHRCPCDGCGRRRERPGLLLGAALIHH